MKRHATIPARAILLCALGACYAGVPTRPAPFRRRPDSVEPGALRGPFDGRVLDADTGRPVAGAMIYASWSFVGGTGLLTPAGWREAVATTDANGRYQVAALRDAPRDHDARLADLILVAYKKGYVAYRSDRRFDDFGPRADFTQRSNVIKLDRWRSDLSHVRHLRYVGGGAALAALTSWEQPEAAAELSQRVGLHRAVAESAGPRATRHLDANRLLAPADVKKTTGFDGTFDVQKLGDEPPSTTYDNVHLRARDLGEAYDVALRVWVLDLAAAQKQFGRVVADMPNVQPRDEIGDRSVRATSDAKDIFGLAFLDGKKGAVVLMTCGASQCRSHEGLLSLARIVKERLDAPGGTAGGTAGETGGQSR